MHRLVPLLLGALVGCPAPAEPSEPTATPAPQPTDPAIPECEPAKPVGPFVSAVHGMAVDADGVLWWSNSYPGQGKTSRIYRRPVESSDDEPTEITGGTLAGLRFEDERLFVCDVAQGRVFVVETDGGTSLEWAVPGPWNTARLDDGTVVAVTYAGEVWSLADDGTTAKLFGGLDAPFGIAPGPDNTMWITEQGQAEGRVTRRDRTGAIVETLEGAWDNPEGIVVTDDGLVIADTSAGAVYNVDRQGTRTLALEVELPIAATALGESALVGTAGGEPRLFRVRACPP